MFKKLTLPLIPFVFLVVLLESLTSSGYIAPYLFPSPSQIWKTLMEDNLSYIQAAQTTLLEAFLGLACSIVIGISFAILMSFSKIFEAAFYPYAVFFQTVPLISIAPILVIWFGYGVPTAIAAAFIVSLFPIIINTLAGIRSTDPALLDIFRLYGANRLQTLFMLRVPHAVPQMITGIRVSAGLSLIGAIVGEFIAGGGLGGLIDVARTQQRLDQVFGAVLISSLAGIIILSIIKIMTRVMFNNHRELE